VGDPAPPSDVIIPEEKKLENANFMDALYE